MVVARVYLVLAFLLPTLCVAEETSFRTFSLPDLGSLQLSVPRSWKGKFREAPHGFPPIIVFSPPQGNGFQILLTPMWSTRTGAVPEKEDMHAIVARAAEEAKRQAVERSIPISELTGESCNGYYFSATDRAPKPGEFKYMTQGMLRIGELVATFTILTNDGGDTVISDALQMLKGARLSPATAL